MKLCQKKGHGIGGGSVPLFLIRIMMNVSPELFSRAKNCQQPQGDFGPMLFTSIQSVGAISKTLQSA